MFVLLMFFLLVAPFPILLLALMVESGIIHICLVFCLKPTVVGLVLPSIPVVVILVYRIVYPAFPFFLFVLK